MYPCTYSLFVVVGCSIHISLGSNEVKSAASHQTSVINPYNQQKRSEKETATDLYEGWLQSPWLPENIDIGPVSAVAIDRSGNVYVFHRAERVWNSGSFDVNNIYQERYLGPIKTSTVLLFHSNGTLLKRWGSGIFYMPHGLTVDHDDNLWTTDVALHQVMKFPPSSNSPSFVKGEKFVPGKDSTHFCKPTSVAVASSGDFFVADGYCNSRILKFNSDGVKILEWGRSTITDARIPGKGELQIPHALTLAEDKGLVCVADRENGRVQCFQISNGTYAMEISSKSIGSRIFGVAYTQAKGGLFFIINGPPTVPLDRGVPVRGFVLSSENVLYSQFGSNLQNPHGLAVSSDGSIVYVGQLEPSKAFKYVHNESASHNEEISYTQYQVTSIGGLAGAMLVTGACLIFAAAILLLAFIYSRSKKSGCHCSSHRWLLSNGSAEGFKLGNILGHQGFEKLNTGEESDEEQPLA